MRPTPLPDYDDALVEAKKLLASAPSSGRGSRGQSEKLK